MQQKLQLLNAIAGHSLCYQGHRYEVKVMANGYGKNGKLKHMEEEGPIDNNSWNVQLGLNLTKQWDCFVNFALLPEMNFNGLWIPNDVASIQTVCNVNSLKLTSQWQALIMTIMGQGSADFIWVCKKWFNMTYWRHYCYINNWRPFSSSFECVGSDWLWEIVKSGQIVGKGYQMMKQRSKKIKED